MFNGVRLRTNIFVLSKKGDNEDVNISNDAPKSRVSLKEIDERLLTIDDYI